MLGRSTNLFTWVIQWRLFFRTWMVVWLTTVSTDRGWKRYSDFKLVIYNELGECLLQLQLTAPHKMTKRHWKKTRNTKLPSEKVPPNLLQTTGNTVLLSRLSLRCATRVEHSPRFTSYSVGYFCTWGPKIPATLTFLTIQPAPPHEKCSHSSIYSQLFNCYYPQVRCLI